MAFLEAKNLWKQYGDSVVLEDINVSVKKGEFVTLVGTSGCGKSTFLRLLLGVEKQSKGQLLMDGEAIVDEPGPDRGIVFQRYSVFPHLSVLDNVVLAEEFERAPWLGRLFGKARTRARENALQLLERVGLHHQLEKYPHQLSGGMQQRLAIAQALMKKPKLMLLDEPFAALDPGIRADMHEMMLDLWRETGLNIFMVTHDLREGFYLGSRLWVFDKDRVDPHNPHAYGSRLTYDIPVGQVSESVYREIESDVDSKRRELEAAENR